MLRKPQGVNRRRFLQVMAGASGALVLGVELPALAQTQAQTKTPTFNPQAFVTLHPDDTVEVKIKHLEMGQGAFTGLAMLVAEELDTRWDQMRAKQADADVNEYYHTVWGPVQGTGGSTGLSNSYLQMRQVGAAMRQMLLSAAAQKWGVDPATLRTEQGKVMNGTEAVSYGELAAAAQSQAVPKLDSLVLKDPKNFIYIGKPKQRLDLGKTNGKAIFTIDLKLPDMLTAVVIHPPKFGATVASFDAEQAKTMSGVAGVVRYINGVAVVADSFWQAQRALKKVKVQWDESKAETLSSDQLWANLKAMTAQKGLIAEQKGDVTKGFAQAAHTIEMEFATPLLPHAAMEPMNCVAKVSKDGCEMWSGFQIPTTDQAAVAKLLGMKPEQVKLHGLIAGSGFGRRGNPAADYPLECADIARQFPERPVKMIWTREVDMRAGWYRPAYFQTVKAAVDAQGNVVAWQQHIAGKPVTIGSAFEPFMVQGGIDHTSVEGAVNMPYNIANTDIQVHNQTMGVPIQWWRAVGHNHTALAKEISIEALARKAGLDPIEFRLKLGSNARYNAALKMAAEKAGWGSALPAGQGMGASVQFLFESYVALIAQVTVQESEIKVDKVTCVVDCGLAVDPDVVEAQLQGGIGFGLGQVLFSDLTLEAGKVKQSNFHNHKVVRIDDMPEVAVYIMPSTEPPTGVGEVSTGAIAPAVVNAIAAATGKYYTQLPIKI